MRSHLPPGTTDTQVAIELAGGEDRWYALPDEERRRLMRRAREMVREANREYFW